MSALSQLPAAARERQKADARWRRLVIEAAGEASMRVVAEAAGVTVGRVHQIVKAART